MNSWIEELKENIAKEFGSKPAIATLATVRSDGAFPAARSVAVRNLFEDGRMLITSDARSEKNRQLKINPAASVVFWLVTQRKQFRIEGTIIFLVVDDPLRLKTWEALSDSARALFFWPPAGELRADHDERKFQKSVAKNQPIPASFEVLQLHPAEAEVLDLNTHPHLRTKWTLRSQAWNGLIVNP